MSRPAKVLFLSMLLAAAALASACGTEKVSVSNSQVAAHAGAVLFNQRCSGCHTLSPAGTEGSDARNVRAEGPNLNQRDESRSQVLFAIRNGIVTV